MSRRLRQVLLFSFIVPVQAGGQTAPAPPDGYFDRLEYRHIGPVGNRVSAVAGVPGDPQIYYFGAASGGVWRTRDAGLHWEPVFDDQPVQSIGALAVAPSDPNVIWVGTGEAHIRSNVSIGNGVYRSVDAGDTWTHVGLESSGRVGRIVVDPRDPDVAFVAALGHLYGPQEERGLYRTRDGGQTWERVLFPGLEAGAVDVVMSPQNPRILFAATWQMHIRTWGRWSGGPQSGLYMSRDGGDSWTRLEGAGLPRPPWGKIGLAMTPADPLRVYALIETSSNDEFEPVGRFQGVLWRSDDLGASWSMISDNNALIQRPLYYTRVVAAPDDRDEVHFLATLHTTSTDGGRTVVRGTSGGDHHDMWIDPMQPDRMIVGHDQGLSISTDRGMSWFRPGLPIAQMYHVYTDNRVPYFVYGNRQDGASRRGPSNSLTGGAIPIGAWHGVGGCESGFAVPDTVSNDVVWSGCYDGILERYEVSTGLARTVSVWPDNPEGWAAADVRYRFQWTFPIHISPHDPGRVYTGSQHVHVTEDGGSSWQVISPDLTRNDVSRQQKTGGLTTDDTSPTYASVLFAIAESPLEEGVLWAGSNDGLVHVSRDGGGTWTELTGRIPGLIEWGTISNIEPSRHQAGTVYLSVDGHQLGDTLPYIYRTKNGGDTWELVVDGIEPSVFSYVHVVREDPRRPGLLYAGTENGLYVSFDAAESWRPLQSNLPHAPVHWLEVQPHFNDLVVATYGRGFWILDDVTPLQQLGAEALSDSATLFRPRPAYRFLNRESPQSHPEDPAAGTNPTYGATIHFALGHAPGGQVRVSVLDGEGETVRRLNAPTAAGPGLYRLHWDLRYEASSTPRLRVPPTGRPGVTVDPETGYRDLGEGGRIRPLAPPGRYTVRLEVDGRVQDQPLEVRLDPGSGGDEAGARAQFAATLQLRELANQSVAAIDEIEWARKGVSDALARLSSGSGAGAEPALESTRDAAAALAAELEALENLLFDLRLSGGLARQDTLRWPRRLYARIVSLAGYISGTDDPPTAQSLEVMAVYAQELADIQARLDEIRQGPLAQFNDLLRRAGLAPIS